MARKSIFALLLVALMLMGLTQPAAAKSYDAERFDVWIDIQADGSYIITESVVFNFSGGPFTYAFREIPWNEVDELGFLDASMDGMALAVGTQANQVEVVSGNPLSIKWHFEPLNDVSRTFTLRYRAVGNLRPTGEVDTLYWKAIPDEHEYDIRAVQVRVTFPEMYTATGLKIEGASGSPQATSGPGEVVWQAGALGENDALAVRLSLPAGSLGEAAPAWYVKGQVRSAQLKQAAPVAGGLGAAILALGGLGLAAWKRRMQPPAVNAYPQGVVVKPPDDLSAVEAELITSNGHVSYRAMMATLLELAARGVVKIEQQETRKPGFGQKNYRISRQPVSMGDLVPPERELVKAAFTERKKETDEVLINELGQRLTKNFSNFTRAAEEQAVLRNLIDAQKLKSRKQLSNWIVMGALLDMVLLAMGVPFVFLAGQTFFGLVIAVALGAIFILTIVAFSITARLSVLTPEGTMRKERWDAFDRYLRDITRSQTALQPEWLEAYLPAAFIFNHVDPFYKAFRKQGLDARISWLQLLPGEDDGGYGFISAAGAASSYGDSGGGGGGGGGGGSSGAG